MIEFAALPMLLSLAAAVIPYLLLRNRIRAKQTVYWSANRLLEQAVKSQARKRDWLRWLLLAVRTLALVALALAVANPLWKFFGSQTTTRNAGGSLYCFVIDCSPSMSLKLQDQMDSATRFSRAVQVVREEVARLSPHEMAAIVTASDSFQVRFLGDGSGTQSLDQTLNELNLSAASVNTSQMVASLDQLIKQSQDRNRSLRNINIRIFSDFSAHDWSPQALDQLNKYLSDRDDNLSFSVQYESMASTDNTDSERHSALVPIRNLSICRMSYSDASMATSSGRMLVDVVNSGTVPTTSTMVQLWADNQLQSTQALSDLSAGDTRSIEFPLDRKIDSDMKIEVRLPEDQLVLDNVGFYIVERTLPRMATLIGRDESATLGLSVAYQSLNASATVHASLDTIIDAGAPQDFHLVDPNTLDSQSLQRLGQLAADGNHVFLWLGGTLPVSNLEQLNSFDVPASKFLKTDWPTSDLAPIIESARRDVKTESAAFTIPLNTYWQLTELRNDWRAILTLGNGEPFALQRSVGSGSLIWIVTPPILAASTQPNSMWNAMARWPTFIPIVDFLRHAASRAVRRNYLVGEDINFVAPANYNLSIERPDESRSTRYTSDQTDLSVKAEQIGWYSIHGEKDSSMPTMSFASNLDCKEINFAQIDLPNDLQTASQSATAARGDDFTRRPLFRILLAICIAFLLVEMLVTSAAALRRA